MRFSACFLLSLGLVATCLPADGASDESATSRPRKKTAATATPSSSKKRTEDDDEKPAPKPGVKKKFVADEEEAAATPKPAVKKKLPADSDEKPDHLKADEPIAKPVVPDATETPHSPAVSIDSSELQGFAEQPEPVRRLIEEALALTKLNLTYKFGSDDPAAGGMDCSGTVAYLLRQHGFKDVPRDASGQYVWARKHGEFFAVVSKKPGGFEFSDLLPGDLMFWNGTYNAGDRDPPVTHSMIYLGVEKRRKQPVMFGSSDGRTYDGKARYGVSVFDFHMPRAETGSKADFLGYARIPGLRTPAVEKPETAVKTEPPEKAEKKKEEAEPPAKATPSPRKKRKVQ